MRASAQGAVTDPAVARIQAFYDVLLTVMKEAGKLGTGAGMKNSLLRFVRRSTSRR